MSNVKNLKKRIAELEKEVRELRLDKAELNCKTTRQEGVLNYIELALLDPHFEEVPTDATRRGKAMFAAIRRLHQLAMK